MEIINYTPEKNEQLLSIRTKEQVMSFADESLNEDAEALAAYWNDECPSLPLIKNQAIEEAWNIFIKEKQDTDWENVLYFVRNLKSEGLAAYHCEIIENIYGESVYQAIFIVTPDTIFIKDPENEKKE
jgi:deoxyribodipyrimidine photolyase-like uncharacterized protein